MEFGPYRTAEELGRGGMGVVYRAHHRDTGAAVALKVPDARAATDEQRARFRREAAVGTLVDHPAVVRVVDHDADGPQPWLALELIEGEPLGRWAKRAAPDWRTAVAVARTLAEALAAAHAHHVIHRDLKPGNVLWGRRAGAPDAEAGPFLTDFGLAKDTAAATKLTGTGEALGTPAYMSPEQARGATAAIGPATDVWALGALLFELCAGRPAFTGESHAGILAAVVHGPLPDTAGLDVPHGVSRLIDGALTRDLRGRYPTAEAFAQDCERVLNGDAPRWRPIRRRRLSGGVAAAAAVAVIAGVTSLPLAARRARVAGAAEKAAQGWALRHDAYHRALSLLGEAVDAAPALHEAQLQRGLLWWAGGRPDRAQAAWTAVPAGAPERRRADVYTALLAFIHFRPAAERAAALARLPSDDSFAGRAGRALRAIRDRSWPAARRALDGMTGWEAAMLRGYIETNDPNGDSAAACRAFDEAFIDGIKLGWALNNRANARVRIGDIDGALDDFSMLIAVRPANALLRRNRALAYKRAGDLAAARADMDVAVRADPDDWRNWDLRAYIRAAQGDPAGALEDLQHAIRRNREEPRLLLDRAKLHQQLGQPNHALRDLHAVVSAFPDFAEGYRRRAALLLDAKRLDAALADADRAVALAPDHGVAWGTRGLVHRAAGRPDAALADLERAMQLDGDNAPLRYELAQALMDTGRPAAAAAQYRAALERQPAFPEAAASLGRALLAAGRPKDARPYLRRFLERHPNHRSVPLVRRWLAEADAAIAERR